MNYPTRALPRMGLVRQNFSRERIEQIENSTYQKLIAAGLKNAVRKGARIAVTAGSRGFGGFNDTLKGVVRALRDSGAEPFIIPAMGSHGGATAEGQKKLLGRLGIHEDEIGAEICATMETISLGRSKSGACAHLDRIVSESDGAIVIGRVKTHPENTEGIASGLLKMTTVGLGKQNGAQEAHSHDLWGSVRAVPQLTLATGKVLFGVAVVENAFREPVAIEVVPGKYEAFYDADKKLLEVAKQHFARVPFEELDLLIVDQIGKNISGSGMDLNVIGSWRVNGGERKPNFRRIAALSLTPESMGNGLGIGLADTTTERFRRDFDPQPTWINLLTATEPNTRNATEGSLPMVLKSDRDAIEVALHASLASDPKVCRITSTIQLEELWISENLLDQAREKGLNVVEPPREVRFNEMGNLF